MAYRHTQPNFSRGEIAEEAEARFDLPAYQAGLRRALNVKVRRLGGVTKRMGTRFVAEWMGTSARLIAFQFSDDNAYALGMGQGIMRPFALGGAILAEGLAVTAITKEAQAKITSAYHGYAVGDQVWLQAIEGMIEINDRFLTVTEVVDANNFRVDFDSTAAGTFTGSGGGTVRVGSPPPPPPPPPVPPPPPPPSNPDVGGGGSGGYGFGGWYNGGHIP